MVGCCFWLIVTVCADGAITVIRGGQMFDTATGRMVPVGAIVIEGEKITAVVPAGEEFVPPADAQVLVT